MSKHLLSIKTDDGNIYKVNSDTLINGDKYNESTDAIYFIESLMCGNEDDYLLHLVTKIKTLPSTLIHQK